MAGVVPEADDGAIGGAVVAEGGEGGGVEGEEGAQSEGLVEPAAGEGAEEVAAGEDQDVALDGAEAGDDAVGAGGDVGDGLAARRAVVKDVPRGVLAVDLVGAEAFVGAVVPFDQVGVELRGACEAGELAGSAGALQGAGEDGGEGEGLETRPQPAGVALAARGEGEVGAAGVLPGERPGGFAVPGEVEDGEGGVDGDILI